MQQVREQRLAKNQSFKLYRDVVWDYIEYFHAFSIEPILKECNKQ
jgi:hypothetical protein